MVKTQLSVVTSMIRANMKPTMFHNLWKVGITSFVLLHFSHNSLAHLRPTYLGVPSLFLLLGKQGGSYCLVPFVSLQIMIILIIMTMIF